MGLRHRRDTAAAWLLAHPTLGEAELGFETDKGYRFRVGDGVTSFSNLPFWESFVGWRPEHNGLLAANYDPTAGITVTNQSPNGGDLNVALISNSKELVINHVHLWCATAGSGLTNVGVGLWSSSGALLSAQVNAGGATTSAFTSGGEKVIDLASPQTILPGIGVYVGFWFTGTTIPKIGAGSTEKGFNIGVDAPSLRFAICDTGLTTTAPATLAAQTDAHSSWWAGVS